MGVTAENLAERYDISRQDCENYSAQSHHRASKNYKSIERELAPVKLRKGVLNKDEHLREEINAEDMKKLRSSFKKEGTVTPATASGVVDGGACVLIASEEFCRKHKLETLCRVGQGEVIGVDPKVMGIGPVPAIQGLLKKEGLSLDQIDAFEINEAFAAQTLACLKELKLSEDKVNLRGGAIALGHPLGATGIKITLTLALILKEQGLKKGISSACIGGGQGIALLLERD